MTDIPKDELSVYVKRETYNFKSYFEICKDIPCNNALKERDVQFVQQ